MATIQSQQPVQTLPADEMNCMDVWGGKGTTQSHFERPGLDVWVWSQSKDNLEHGGGDLHLISSCASGRITRMLMADVCSYGSSFVDTATDFRELIKRHVNVIQQSGLIKQLSSQLVNASDRGCFASLLLGTYFEPTSSFTLCNVGHPPPILYSAAAGEWSVLKHTSSSPVADNCPPGVVDPAEYQEFKVKLGTGDMVLSYSNVLTECRNARGGTIGLQGVLERVRQLDVTSPGQLASRLVDCLRGEHVTNLEQADTTILLCCATGRSVGWRNNLLAPFRLFRAVQDHTRFE